MENNIINIITLIVATGGLVVSFFAFSISLKDRRNSLRESIHNRQLDALDEILSVTIKLHLFCIGNGIRSQNKNKNEVMDIFDKLFYELNETKNSKVLVYPDELNKPFRMLMNEYLAFSDKIEANNIDLFDWIEAVDGIKEKYFFYINEVRKYMKLKELSDENINLIKTKNYK